MLSLIIFILMACVMQVLPDAMMPTDMFAKRNIIRRKPLDIVEKLPTF